MVRVRSGVGEGEEWSEGEEWGWGRGRSGVRVKSGREEWGFIKGAVQG